MSREDENESESESDREERVATPKEVREAIQKEWTAILPRLVRYARFLTLGDKTRARDLVERAVDSFLKPDGRKWPIERVPSLRTVMLLAIKSHFLDDLRKRARQKTAESDRVRTDPDEQMDWSFNAEVMNALALEDAEAAVVVKRAREILAADSPGLAVLRVLEGEPRDDLVLQREAKRTGKHVNVVVELARRRMGRALERALAELRKS